MIERTLSPLAGGFPEKIDIQKAESHQLSNGIPLFILRGGTQPVVKIEVLFKAGGNGYEKKSGQSFFANKLLNSGTRNKSSAEISEIFAEFGASLEISPSFDSSSISIFCLEKHLTNILPLFISIVTDVNYPEEELNREKDLQVANLRLQQTKTNIRASKAFRSALFPNNHAYGNIMSEENINSLSSQDLRDFHHNNLNNYEVLVSGHITDTTLSFIEKEFESLHVGSLKNTVEIDTPIAVDAIKLRYPMDNSVQCSIRIGKRMVEKTHPDYIFNLITNHIFGGYFGSRLMKNIREEKGLTYGIYSSIISFNKASYFVIAADVKKDVINHALEEIYRELDILSNVLISETELATVKNHMIGSYQSELSSIFTLSSKFKNIHQFGLGYDYYDKYLQMVKTITPEQIQVSAKKHFNTQLMSEVITGALS